MEERFTVQLDVAASPEKVAKLAERLAEAFLLSQEEAQALLSADTLVLKRPEALALVKMCHQEGVGVSLDAPLLTPVVRTQRWLKRYTLPVVFSLSSIFALALLIFWVVPNGSPHVKSADLIVERGGASAALPWIDSADSLPSTEAGDDVIVVEPYLPGESDLSSDIAAEAFIESENEDELVSIDSLELSPTATPDLFSAARDLSASELQKLLDVSPSVDLRDAYGQTPLMYAVEANKPQSVRQLLAAGADPNALTDANWTPLMYAARSPDNATNVETLLKAGADPSVKNASGETALELALDHNRSGAAALLESALAERTQPLQAARAQVRPVAPVVNSRPSPESSPASVEAVQVQPVMPEPLILDSAHSSIVEVTPGPAFSENADPALQLFDRQSADLDNEVNRNLILECLQDWASCAEE